MHLRLINGATATAFWIDLGGPDRRRSSRSTAIPVKPVRTGAFPLAQGQRVDVF